MNVEIPCALVQYDKKYDGANGGLMNMKYLWEIAPGAYENGWLMKMLHRDCIVYKLR